MNTLDMPTSYLPALEMQDAVGKDLPMDTLPVDLMALIDNCTTEWATDDGEDPFAALGGESYEQLLEEGVTLLDGGCGLIEDVLDFVTEEVAAAPCAEAEEKPDAQPAEAPDEEPATPFKYFTAVPDPDLELSASPFSLNSMWNADKLGFYPSPDIWNKFDFPADVEEPVEELRSGLDIADYPKKKIETWIDWDTDVDHSEPARDTSPKRSAVKESPMWGTVWEYGLKPMPTPAQLRRKLMEEGSPPRQDDFAVTPDNALPLANRSTTVPAASALKTRPMRSLLNTKQQQQQHVYKSTSSRSLLLSNARSKVQTAAPSQTVVKQKSVTATCDPVPPAVSSVEIKAASEDETVSASSRPETPQSQSDSEDEAPVFRHNTIDTIFTSTLCDSSSTVYLTPSDSSGSPKSTICDEDDDDDDDEEEEGEDYEHANLRSPPESVIREERPARTVLPYISDHSYHLSKSNVRIDGLGVQTPSDSEEEIDVVSVGGDKGTARLPNNPSARDRRQIQIKVATAIHRQSRHQTTTVAAEAPSGSRKRQASATPTRNSVKRTRVPPVPLVLGRGKGKGKAFGRGRRRANADEEPDPCEKRSMHNSMERQRRIDLRNLVDRLRATVPATEDNKRAAKVTILQEAAKYCLALAARAQAYEAEKARLWSKQEDLHVRLSALRREAAEQRRKLKKLENPAHAPCYDDEYFTAEEIKPEPVEVDCEDEEHQYYREF